MKGKVPFLLKAGIFVVLTLIITLVTSQLATKPDIIASGTLSIEEGLEDYASANKTLFLVIYDQDPSKPMPLGVMKEPIVVSSAGVIRKFSITPEKVKTMMSKDPIPKVFKIKARLDRDGQGGMDQQGDITAILENVRYGSEDNKILFNTKI